MAPAEATPSPYDRVLESFESDRCVVLDGGLGTELPRVGAQGDEERLWGTRALLDSPDTVLDVHNRYVATGCDVISTNTWGLPAALDGSEKRVWGEPYSGVHWMDAARRGLRLARQAADESGGAGPAVAFSLGGDLDSPAGREMIPLLARLFADEPQPPDLILVETLPLVRESVDDTVAALLELGLPLWLSFRRCLHGPCGVFGQHWGGPEGDAFGRAARRFEQMGVGAILINCIPPDHVVGVTSYLRDFTDLPLGVYPNLGYLTDQGWSFDLGVGPDEYARMALGWREEGARIVGGCCGVRPHHIAAAREALEGTKPGRRRFDPIHQGGDGAAADAPAPSPWLDSRRRPLHPVPFPDLTVDPGVHPPNEASFMVWRHLFREGIGAHQRCLDAGCGTGILGIQLALNGATHVRAIDIDKRAVANTLTNSFRNGVDDRVSATTVDIYPWVPEERFEVIVASLHQQPVDPLQVPTSHRALDYWGRNLLDQLITKLPQALAPEGVAYLLQLSVLSQQRTMELLGEAGFEAEVADYTLFGFPADLHTSEAQIERVEELSDAYHLKLGGRDVMVGYLLRVTPKDAA